MTTLTTATTTARWDSESATGLTDIVARSDEIFEAAAYATDALSEFFFRLQEIHSNIMQTTASDTASSIEGLYSPKGKTAVARILDEHSFLIPLLMEARERLDVYFPNSEVSLEVITDPETEGDYQLLAAVSTDLTADDAYRKLKEFDRAWWLDELGRSQSLLCISIDLQ
jgi:hypothetical protein